MRVAMATTTERESTPKGHTKRLHMQYIIQHTRKSNLIKRRRGKKMQGTSAVLCKNTVSANIKQSKHLHRTSRTWHNEGYQNKAKLIS